MGYCMMFDMNFITLTTTTITTTAYGEP